MDYTYIFPDFTDRYETVQVIHHKTGKNYRVSTRIDDSALALVNSGAIPSTFADLIDLAASLYIADWLSPRTMNTRHNIRIVLPVRNPNLFNQSSVLEGLTCLLDWYTGDHWQFEFRRRQELGRVIERQPKLFAFDEGTEVAAWSGGLDSMAGLCGRLKDNTAPQYTLLGTGINTYIQGKQSEIANGLRERWPQPIKLIQLPIQLQYPDSTNKPPTNDLFRARGLVFKLMGTVCACLEGQNRFYFYENGYGALNLRFQLSQGEQSHSRAVHPLSLLDTADFISRFLSTPFSYENPYLFTTKAQMCEAVGEDASLAFSTVTCDGRHRQADQPSQCGYCSSCLLRRMALLIALGEDQTEYVITQATVSPQPSHGRYFEAMRRQAVILSDILSSPKPWEALLDRHPRLRVVAGRLAAEWHEELIVVQDQLLKLYRCHVTEWQYAESTLQKHLTN